MEFVGWGNKCEGIEPLCQIAEKVTIPADIYDTQVGHLVCQCHGDGVRAVVRISDGGDDGLRFILDIGREVVDCTSLVFGETKSVAGRCIAKRPIEDACDLVSILLRISQETNYPVREVARAASCQPDATLFKSIMELQVIVFIRCQAFVGLGCRMVKAEIFQEIQTSLILAGDAFDTVCDCGLAESFEGGRRLACGRALFRDKQLFRQRLHCKAIVKSVAVAAVAFCNGFLRRETLSFVFLLLLATAIFSPSVFFPRACFFMGSGGNLLYKRDFAIAVAEIVRYSADAFIF